jgi:hypothetical protein
MDAQDRRLDDFGTRMAALVEAQRETQESQKQAAAGLSALVQIVADLGRAQTRTEQALASLTERFDRYIGAQDGG